MQRFLLTLICFLGMQPAIAGSWLVFPSGQTSPSMAWTATTAPASGANVPSGSTVLPWTQTNGDSNPNDYQLQSGAIVYSPPVAPAVVHPNLVDVQAFEQAVWADTNSAMTPAVKFQIAQIFPIMEANAYSLPNLQAGYAGAVAAYGGSWFTSDVQSEVKSLASVNNIQLVP